MLPEEPEKTHSKVSAAEGRGVSAFLFCWVLLSIFIASMFAFVTEGTHSKRYFGKK